MLAFTGKSIAENPSLGTLGATFSPVGVRTHSQNQLLQHTATLIFAPKANCCSDAMQPVTDATCPQLVVAVPLRSMIINSSKEIFPLPSLSASLKSASTSSSPEIPASRFCPC